MDITTLTRSCFRQAAQITAVASLALLAACNGTANTSDGGSNTEPTPTPAPSVQASRIDFLLSSKELPDNSAVSVTATVMDNGNKVISDAPVTLAVTSGSLINATATTNEAGQVTAELTTGGDATPRTITITATSGSAVATALVTVVGNSAKSVKVGTSNVTAEPTDTQYSKPYNVLVTDANGLPVKNATVQLTLEPIRYWKGYREWDQTVTPNAWTFTSRVMTNCTSGGDCKPATVNPANVITDANGFAFFNVIYAKNYAGWAEMRLTATATLSGNVTATDVSEFTLMGLAKDYQTQGISSPGRCSPFNALTDYVGTCP
ncbi:Ig-like domain-containing protein [Chitiniphilus purpureus]|uniref:Ig-like domain-containing protein n=1 Tax=Chitiniphilus purpureus TaxID=2981137 RepID=A0ABY6DPW1_9NEIS|nr:Ig-like domain-containing protein [Chitiniphilus sp. CD1]UXY16395.1 Ig-like domain-containing protein [Chitiniphilus sp. CD1]